MKRISTLLLAAAMSSPAACRVAPGAAPSGGPIAIENATVLPMDSARVLPAHTVVVADGRIVAVGPTGRVAVPAGARRIDGRGLWVMPGLADMHVHLYDAGGFASYLRHGVTTVANLDGSPDVLELRRRVASGELTGPTIVTSGPSIDGNPPGNPLFEATDSPERARRIVRGQVEAGYDLIKVYGGLSEEAYAAVRDEASTLGVPVTGHVPGAVGIDGVLAARQDGIAHTEEFFQQGSPPEFTYASIASRTRAAGTFVTPNLFAYADYLRSIADLPGTLSDPEMRFASAAALSEKLPSNNRSIRPNPEVFATVLRQRQPLFRRLTRAMADSGVPLMVGTDTEIFGTAGASAVSELEELVLAGLTPMQTLMAATANAGRFMARSRLRDTSRVAPFGLVAQGHRADLLLLEADPTRDVRNVTRLRGIVLRGAWLPVSRLDELRDSTARAHAAGHVAVRRFDSLVSAGRVEDAVREMRERASPDGIDAPIAHVALLGYAFRLGRADAPDRVRLIRELQVALFPRSVTSHLGLATSELARGDTAAARRQVAMARELRPNDARVDALAARVGGPASRAGRP